MDKEVGDGWRSRWAWVLGEMETLDLYDTKFIGPKRELDLLGVSPWVETSAGKTRDPEGSLPQLERPGQKTTCQLQRWR